MKKLFGSMVLFLIAFGCNPADDQEFSKYCPHGDCYISATKTSSTPSTPITWSNTTDSGPPPGSGSDKPWFGSDSNDIPDDDTGSLGSSAQPPVSTGGPTTIGSSGSGQPEGPTGGHGDTDHGPTGGNCKTPGDCSDGTENDPKSHGKTPFEKTLDRIGGGIANVAGELNGTNNKKRKKAREAKALLRDAQDTFQQADDLATQISQETAALNGLGLGLNQAKSGFELNASDQAFGDITTRYNQKTKGILDKTPEFDEGKDPVTANNGQGVYYENQKIATARKYVGYARQHVETLKGQADYAPRKAIVDMADEALNTSEASYKEGKPAEGSVYYELGMAFADVALSLTPIVGTAKDAIELATGKSLLDGHQLTTFERSMAGVGIATLGLAKFGAFGKLAKIGGILAKGSTGAEDAAKIAKGLERGEEIAAAAARNGVKDEKAVNEIAEAVTNKLPCRVAIDRTPIPVRMLLSLIEDTAYAGDCLIGEAEEAVVEALDAAKEAKINLKDADLSRLKDNPLNGTSYTEKVLAQKKTDIYHGFSDYVDNFAGIGEKTEIIGGDGIKRVKIELEGGWAGKDGHFEWIIESDRTVNHRIFTPSR